MDSLVLKTSWDKKSKTSDITATISGLYIQGAVMKSASGLEPCSRDTPSWSPAPSCSLTWTTADEVRRIFKKLKLSLWFTVILFGIRNGLEVATSSNYLYTPTWNVRNWSRRWMFRSPVPKSTTGTGPEWPCPLKTNIKDMWLKKNTKRPVLFFTFTASAD